MKKFLTLSAFLGACASDPYTWGDATSDVSEAFCGRIAECYDISDEDRDKCTAHTEFHFCQEADCDAELPAKAEGEAEACVDALATADCYWLGYWGLVPEECGPILEREPE